MDVINYYDENSGTLTISLDPQNHRLKMLKAILQSIKSEKFRFDCNRTD